MMECIQSAFCCVERTQQSGLLYSGLLLSVYTEALLKR